VLESAKMVLRLLQLLLHQYRLLTCLSQVVLSLPLVRPLHLENACVKKLRRLVVGLVLLGGVLAKVLGSVFD
jgi:hypothetical protein